MNKIENEYGYCEYSFEKDYVHIYNLFIKPEYRRKGHARKLLQITISEIRKTGYDGEIDIVAQPDNGTIPIDALIKFYKSLGLDVYNYYG
jgi:ribosomal protein S18 acetylase RimI-like enzyme